MIENIEVIINGKKYVDEMHLKNELIRSLNQDMDDADSSEERLGIEIAEQRIFNTSI